MILVGIFWERVAPTHGLATIFLQGVRFDLILLGLLFGLVSLFKLWFHSIGLLRRIGNWVFPLYTGIVAALAFFVEASTTSFIGQFDSRPNYLFVEYLEYPKEVLGTLAVSNLPELIIFTSLALFLAWTVTRWMRKDPYADLRVPLWYCLLMTPVILVVSLAMIRSTLEHRPVNPAHAAFSQDAMVNQLPLNSPYSVLHAIYEHRKAEANKGIRYGDMADNEVLRIVLHETGITSAGQLDPETPTLHRQFATQQHDRPLNLVIVLEESLGADYVGSLGGKDLTPTLDSLVDEGIWFERLYATGILSARGIEALIAGFTPSPHTNVVKRSDTQNNFFTLAGLLAGHGYQTSFIYGGESRFDNMRRFFLNNGFQTIIDQDDYDSPEFVGTWGVSDEDLFRRAHLELGKMGDQPFFSLIFSSSHHEPFEIPENRVTESKYGPRETSIKYADYALGIFLDQVRKSNYWNNTVFLIIADHNARVFRGNLVPVERFRVPAAIIGPTIKPRRITGITSQIDILPTLLSLIGLDSVHPAIGRDLTLPEYVNGSGRAMMQFHANQAYIEDEGIVVLQPDLEPMFFRLNAEGEMENAPGADPELERKALAHALWGPLTIKRKAYSQPGQSFLKSRTSGVGPQQPADQP